MKDAALDDLALVPWRDASLPVLTLDGTTGKRTYPEFARERAAGTGGAGPLRLAATHDMPAWARRVERHVPAAKMSFPESSGAYAYVLESLLLSGVTAGPDGRAARQLFYVTNGEYGASYRSLFDSVSHVPYAYADDSVGAPTERTVPGGVLSAQPAVAMTAEDEAVAEAAMAHCVPIPPCAPGVAWWDADTAAALGLPPPAEAHKAVAKGAAAALAEALHEQGLRIEEWREGPAVSVVVASDGAKNAAAVSALANVLGSAADVRAVCVRAECLRDSLWELHVRVRAEGRSRVGKISIL